MPALPWPGRCQESLRSLAMPCGQAWVRRASWQTLRPAGQALPLPPRPKPAQRQECQHPPLYMRTLHSFPVSSPWCTWHSSLTSITSTSVAQARMIRALRNMERRIQDLTVW